MTRKARRYWSELIYCLQIGADFSSRARLALATVKFHLANGFGREPRGQGKPEHPAHYRIVINGNVVELWLRSYAGDIFIFYEVFMDRAYALPRNFNEKVSSVIDLGAHIGLTTLYLANIFKDAHFVCVEPDAENATVLKKNIIGLSQRVQVIEAAVSHRSGYATLSNSKWGWGGQLQESEEGARRVRCYTMEEIMEIAGCGSIDILKIDIEGEERLLLAHSENWLKFVRLAIMELHDAYSAAEVASSVTMSGIQVIPPTPEFGNRLTVLLNTEWVPSRSDQDITLSENSELHISQASDEIGSNNSGPALTLVFIACSGHSGSTLLEMLLANHPDVFGLGEFNHFADYYDDPFQRCGCGASVAQCEFWTTVVRQLQIDNQSPMANAFPTERLRPKGLPSIYGAILLLAPWLFRWWGKFPHSLANRNLEILRNYWNLTRSAALVARSTVVVDKSMSPSHVLELLNTRPEWARLKVIFLVRDGRANMYSNMRSLALNAETAAKNWQRMNRHIQWISSRLPADAVYKLRYEDLCWDPEKAVRSLCDFIGLIYEPGMLTLNVKAQHGIAGNAMRHRGDSEIRLDERWKTQLSPSDLFIFERIAGEMNRSFGYR